MISVSTYLECIDCARRSSRLRVDIATGKCECCAPLPATTTVGGA